MNKRFLKNTGWIIGGKIVQSIISLVVGALTARFLGPSNYGIIGYITSFIAFFTSFATLGLNNVIVKALLDNEENQGTVIGTAITMKIISSSFCVLLIEGLLILTNLDNKLIWICGALQSVGLLFQSFDIIEYWYQSKLKSKISVLVTLTAFIITNIYKIILLVLDANVIYFAFAHTFDFLLIAVFNLALYRINKGAKFAFSKSIAKSLIKSSKSFIIAGLMVAVYAQTDKIMIKEMLGLDQVGYYSAAVSAANTWVFILAAIITSANPLIMQAYSVDKELYKKRLIQLFSAIIYISIFAGIGISLLAKYIILILYGKSFEPAINALRIVTWYTTFSYLGVAKNVYLLCENKQKYVKYFAIGGALCNLVLNFIFIPILGINGAALASLLTQIITNFIMPMVFRNTRDLTKYTLKAFVFWKVFSFKKSNKNN